MGVAAAGAVLMGLFSRNKVEPEEEIAAERLVRDREEL